MLTSNFRPLPLVAAFLFILSGSLTAQLDSLVADGEVHEIGSTGAVQEFLIPENWNGNNFITFRIDGADGGTTNDGVIKSKGGGGSVVKVTFPLGMNDDQLQAGGTLRFIVGQRGKPLNSNDNGAGGGGGSALLYTLPGGGTGTFARDNFTLADEFWVLLGAAGGGGGAGKSSVSAGSNPGSSGREMECGSDGDGSNGGDGGCASTPGQSGSTNSSGCGGGSSRVGSGGCAGEGGGLAGGAGGSGVGNNLEGGYGFGGGGSAGGNGGGGGGGYGGGGGGGNRKGGGGGGSFASTTATNPDVRGGSRTSFPSSGRISYFFVAALDGAFAQCKDIEVELSPDQTVTVDAQDLDNGSVAEAGESITNIFFVNPSFTGSLTYDCDDLGEHPVTIAIQTSGGQASICTATIDIVSADTAACKNLTIELLDDNPVTLTENNLYGGYACGVLNDQVTFSQVTFDLSDLGVDTVIATAPLVAGGTFSCRSLVSVEDYRIIPACLGLIDLTLDASGQASLSPEDIDIGSFAGQGIQSLTLSQETFNCSDFVNLSDDPVTLVVTDTRGAQASCQTIVRVRDRSAPTARCRDVSVALDENGTYELTREEIDNGSDNGVCNFLSYSLSQSSFTCADAGVNTVTLTVNSLFSGTAIDQCTATVTVTDAPPEAVCVDRTVELGSFFANNLSLSELTENSTDDCGIESLITSIDRIDANGTSISVIVTDIVPLECEDIGNPLELTINVIDGSGNSSSCTSVITVVNETINGALCPDVTIRNDEGIVTADELGSNIFLDCVDLTGFNYNFINPQTGASLGPTLIFDCDDVGSQQYLITYLPPGGGQGGSCAGYIEIIDAPPAATCIPLVEVTLDETGMADISAAMIDDGSSDDCTGITLSLDRDHFTCEDLAGGELTLTVADAAGNTATCTSTLTVVENSTVSCQVLPVELVSFTGEPIGKANYLAWSVAGEAAFSHYELQRSSAGPGASADHWITIANILGAAAGAGQVGQAMSYQFVDDHPLAASFYRLRMVDLDAGSTFSDVIYLEQENTDELKIYPNPNKGRFTVELPSAGGETVLFIVHDLAGRMLWRSKSAAAVTVALDNLRPGIYLLSANLPSGRCTRRFRVQ